MGAVLVLELREQLLLVCHLESDVPSRSEGLPQAGHFRAGGADDARPVGCLSTGRGGPKVVDPRRPWDEGRRILES